MSYFPDIDLFLCMWQIFLLICHSSFDIMLSPFTKTFLTERQSNAANLSFRVIVFYFISYFFWVKLKSCSGLPNGLPHKGLSDWPTKDLVQLSPPVRAHPCLSSHCHHHSCLSATWHHLPPTDPTAKAQPSARPHVPPRGRPTISTPSSDKGAQNPGFLPGRSASLDQGHGQS